MQQIYYEYKGCSLKYSITQNKKAVVGTNQTTSSYNAVNTTTRYNAISIPETIENEAKEKFEVTEIGVCAFFNYNSLESISLPKTLLQINVRAFDLALVNFNLELPENIEFIGSLAFASNNIEYIKIGKNVATIDSAAFAYSRKACVIDVSKDNNQFSIDESHALYDKLKHRLIQVPTNLSSFNIPSSVKFIDCSALGFSVMSEIMIPVNVERIGAQCFSYMRNLKKIIIHGNIKIFSTSIINANVFCRSNAITDVYYCGTRFVDGVHFSSDANVSVHTCIGYKKEKFMSIEVDRLNECIAYPIRCLHTGKSCKKSLIQPVMLYLILVL